MGFRPEGAEQISQGQRPGTWKSNRPSALKGRDTDTVMFRPFRAPVSTSNPIPGRCPGLIRGCPFGATDKSVLEGEARSPLPARTACCHESQRAETGGADFGSGDLYLLTPLGSRPIFDEAPFRENSFRVSL